MSTDSTDEKLFPSQAGSERVYDEETSCASLAGEKPAMQPVGQYEEPKSKLAPGTSVLTNLPAYKLNVPDTSYAPDINSEDSDSGDNKRSEHQGENIIDTPTATTEEENEQLVINTDTVIHQNGMLINWRNICQRINKKICIGFSVATVLLLICITGFVLLGVPLYTMSYKSELYPGTLVELVSFPYFVYDKAQISEEVEDGEKADAQIYFGIDCESRVDENETYYSSDKYLPFTHPDSVDNLSPVYLLKASRLEFSTSIDQSSDLSNPVKLCRFDNEDALMALNEARDKDTINKAEKKGRCHNINKSSNSTLIDIVPSTSYYYYALSALSSQGVSVDILYQYIAYIKFYNKSDFELRDCSVSDDDCIFTGLTWIKDANLMKNTFCFLAYIPVPPSQEKDQYTYTTTLSKPIGFFILLGCSTLLIIFLALFLVYVVIKRYRP